MAPVTDHWRGHEGDEESNTSTSIKREDSSYSDFLRNYKNDSDIIEIHNDSSDFYADLE